MQSFHATYQKGVFRPVGPVPLPEGTEVHLQIVTPASEPPQQQDESSQKGVLSIEDCLAQLAAGVPEKEWDALPVDLSENLDVHLYGMNRE